MTEPKIAPWIIEAHAKQTELEYRFSHSPSVKARVLGILQRDFQPVIVAFRNGVEEVITSVSGDGKEFNAQRIVPPRQTRRVWANIYTEGCATFSSLWKTRKDADHGSVHGRIACVPVEISFTPGEGLT